jgi:hypothetical protein
MNSITTYVSLPDNAADTINGMDKEQLIGMATHILNLMYSNDKKVLRVYMNLYWFDIQRGEALLLAHGCLSKAI